MNTSNLKAEILAPASNFESVKAAYNAGADAIYIGGLKFGARAYADNMNEDELKGAIDYAHLYDKRIYMTVNTLLKNSEIENELYEYLLPYYEQGLDAVIVQDLGVMNFVKKYFPKMAVHASTQMAITGEYMPEFLEKAGIERIVTARELSLDEIRAIHKKAPNIEIESFVHGALCMGYSGMCFFSSFLGERSGNRGRCAQACRLPYTLLDENKNIVKAVSDKDYMLSPKDICTLEILPDIIESGVYSLKIEGRMKRIEYTALVTAMYRKYLDLYLENGRNNYKISKEDLLALAQIYNRGGFSDGYYTKRNAADMMSMERPNHYGVYVGKLKLENKKLILNAQTDLNKGDVIELRNKNIDNRTDVRYNEITLKNDVKKNTKFNVPLSKDVLSQFNNTPVYRLRNSALLNEINDKYVLKENKIPLKAFLKVNKGFPVKLIIKYKDNEIICEGAVIEPAKNQGATVEALKKSLNKTGNTKFYFEDIKIDVEDECFVPVKVINELRREALDKILEQILKPFKRSEKTAYIPLNKKKNSSKDIVHQLIVNVSSKEQIKACLNNKYVNSCYVDMNMFNINTDKAFYLDIKEEFKKHEKMFILSLPVILRKDTSELIIKNAEWLFNGIAGVLVHNAEQLMFMNEIKGILKNKLKDDNFNIKIIADYMLYSMNDYAIDFLKDNNVSRCTLPVELTKKELKNIADKAFSFELIFYGYLPMMFTAQCQQKNIGKCIKANNNLYLKDRKNKLLNVRMNCNYCYNTIYNSSPFSLFGLENEVKEINADVIRIHFSNENYREADLILNKFSSQFYENKTYDVDMEFETVFTRGHFKRGVE